AERSRIELVQPAGIAHAVTLAQLVVQTVGPWARHLLDLGTQRYLFRLRERLNAGEVEVEAYRLAIAGVDAVIDGRSLEAILEQLLDVRAQLVVVVRARQRNERKHRALR